MDRLLYICAAVAGFTGVGLDAFAAHGLRSRIPALLPMFETAVRYQIYHALALFAVAWAWSRWQHCGIAAAGLLFVAGILFFCGSIYLRVLADLQIPMLAPIGGMAFLAGWLCLCVGVTVRGKKSQP